MQPFEHGESRSRASSAAEKVTKKSSTVSLATVDVDVVGGTVVVVGATVAVTGAVVVDVDDEGLVWLGSNGHARIRERFSRADMYDWSAANSHHDDPVMNREGRDTDEANLALCEGAAGCGGKSGLLGTRSELDGEWVMNYVVIGVDRVNLLALRSPSGSAMLQSGGDLSIMSGEAR